MTTPAGLRITDAHIHMQPWESFRPATLDRMRRGRPDFDQILEMSRDPSALLRYLDSVGVERAALVNYAAPEVMGFGAETNGFVARYVKADPSRLIAVGSVNPRHAADPAQEVESLAEAGIRALKLHPPHMLVRADAHLDDTAEGAALAHVYAAASRARLPVIIHTGTSIFPGARARLGDPMAIDDVAVDFPDLSIVMAHGGRPLWMPACFFLMRRHPNLWMDLSGIPPRSLPEYFPRLVEVADRVLFGTDWPSPGVRDIGANIAAFLDLPDAYLPEAAKHAILQDNALRLFPA
ncbi:MAG TPA: amidohydrolase family protein [Candidatus Polarisedimenticolia bacterium]|nr:amidohydrolase family protein [Candidatus Polarisedimenticolia bacterium]